MANPSGLKAALLDFDQTLVDLPVDWDNLRSDIRDLLGSYGATQPLRWLHPGLEAAIAELQERGVSPARLAGVRRKVNRLLTDYEMTAVPGAKAIRGAKQLIDTARSHRMKVIIQSSNSIHAIQQSMDRLGFPRVDAIVGRESAPNRKPHPQGVRRVLRRFGLRGDQCVVIGDGDFDVQLGQAIGAATIRIGEGRLGADHTVNSLSEASRILFGKRGAA